MSFRTVKAFRLKELSAFTSKLKDGASASETPIQLLNPFLPHKNPLTGRWAPPKYSLRQQADLVKSAKASSLTHLLPFRPKSATALNADSLPVAPSKPVPTEWWQADIVWKDSKPPVENKEEKKGSLEEDELPKKVAPRIQAKQMEGLAALKMYAGRKRMFKGHKWERVQARRQKRTQILMRDMNKRIIRYKEVRTILPDFTSVETHRMLPSGTTVASLIRSSHQEVLRLLSYRSRTYSSYNICIRARVPILRPLLLACLSVIYPTAKNSINMVVQDKEDHVDSSATSATVALRLTGLELSESSTSSIYAARG